MSLAKVSGLASLCCAAIASTLMTAALTLPLTLTSGCGGCYQGGDINNLQTVPESQCVRLQASAADICNGEFSLEVTNNCTEDLILAGETLSQGDYQQFSRRGSGPEQLSGTLGGEDITIQWDFVPRD